MTEQDFNSVEGIDEKTKDLDPIIDATIVMQDTNRFEPYSDSIMPKYTIRGANGKIYRTNDCHVLSILGGLAADARMTPGGLTFSVGIRPDNCQPSGALNIRKIPVHMDICPPPSEDQASNIPYDDSVVLEDILSS